MNRKIFRHILLFVIVFLVIVTFLSISIPAYARPGGGSGYTGGGGGGGGGGDLIGLLIYLIFSLLPPYISIPLVIIIIIIYSISKKKANSKSSKQVVSGQTYYNRNQTGAQSQLQLQQLKAYDPNFSRVLFVDFVNSLYVKFYMFHNDKKEFNTILPFFNKAILDEVIKSNKKIKINEIVIGNIDIELVMRNAENTQITTLISSNYTAIINGKTIRFIVSERWMFERQNGVMSAEPEKLQKLSCPNCGAPAHFTDAGECEHCGTLIVPGQKQWVVQNRAVIFSQTIKTNALLSYAPEVGTNYPTITSNTVENEKQQFANNHNTTWDHYWSIFYHNIASKYFYEIYEHWSDLKWEKVRHLLTDRLWESYLFWIKQYKEYGYRNMLDETKISKMHVAKIEIDKFYEAITVRIFASTKDYVVNKEGKVVAGNNKTPRVFSEYWTFIRRIGVEKDDYDMKSCPNCGAPLDKMGQDGVCEYCSTKVTTGNFSWVLAAIIQDEEYKG